MERLRRLRTEQGLSQARLAARAELDPSTVNQIERGARAPTTATLHKLAEALGVGLAKLLEDEAPKADAPPSPAQIEARNEERRELYHFLKSLLDNAATRGEIFEEELKNWDPSYEWPIGDVAMFATDWAGLDYLYEKLVSLGQDTDEKVNKAKARIDEVKNRISELVSRHPGRVLDASQKRSLELFRSRRIEQEWQQNSDETAADDAG
jgi:transcriptional regulator with XRE-family HTH domain